MIHTALAMLGRFFLRSVAPHGQPAGFTAGALLDNKAREPHIMNDLDPKPPGHLLAVVSVDQLHRVVCQAPGCGHTVYRRIHVVQRRDSTLGVYGSECFQKLFGQSLGSAPRYGGGDGRELTAEERELLAHNTQQLIKQFETEHQEQLERARQRLEQLQKVQRAARERQEQLEAQAARRRPPSAAELASVEAQAKANIRARFNVDPNAPGWRGLVMTESLKLLGR